MRRIVFLYALFAGLWVGLSEAAMSWWFADPAQRALAATLEGWVFVGVTGALLYALVGRLVRRREAAFAREREALQSQDRTLLLLRTLADNAPDVIYAKDREGRYLLRNAAALRETGSSATQVIGRDDSAIFPAQQAQQLRAHDERVMAQDHSESFEEELDTVDGRRTFVSTKSPLHDAAGRVIGMFGIARDVTQRRELERQHEAARTEAVAARDLLREVLVRVNDGFVALDRDWRYTYVNAPAAHMLGRDKPEDLLGRHIWTEYPEGVGQPFHRAYEQAMASQQPVVFEDYYAPWGRWFENRVYPSPDGLTIYFSDITLRRQAEQALREREERLRLSELRYRLASASGQVWDWDVLSGRFATAPESWWQQVGVEAPPDGATIKRLEDLMHPEDVPRWQRALRDHLSQRVPYDIEFRARHASGEWRWFHTQGQAVWDAAGRATYMAGTTFDISARKQAEESLREREQRLQQSELRYRLAAAGGHVWDWDIGSDRANFPDAFWEQLGCSPPPTQSPMARFEALLHPDDVPRRRHAMREHLAQRAPYNLELRARHANGGWRWLHTQGQAVWDADDRATYMAGTTFDITERKLAEQALSESDAYRSNLLEQLADGVLLVDSELRFLGANRQALVMLGYAHDELLRLRVHDVLPGFEHARAEDEVRAVMAGLPHLAEWELRRSDGSQFRVEASARVLDDRCFVAVLRDITARREAERAVLGYQLELSELTHQLLSQEKTTTQRIAQALHDHLGQTLGAARLNLDACMVTHAAAMPAALKELGGRISMLLDQAVHEVRQVLADLRPPLLEEQGLAAALDNEIRSRTVLGGNADVLLEAADAALEQRWPAAVEYSAFMVAREAIANALQHAGATLVRVMLDGDARRMMLDVVDDGAGIPAPMARGRPGHLGIVGMRERAIAIGARFGIDTQAQGGTCVTLRWEAREP